MLHFLLTIIALLLTTGCKVSPTPAPTLPITSTTARVPIGYLSPGSLTTLISEPSCEEAEVHIDADGAMRKLAVEHHNAAVLPAALQQAADKEWPGHHIKGYETEIAIDRDHAVEIAVITADGRHCELNGSSSGVVYYTECVIAPEHIPAPVLTEIKRLFPNGEITQAEHRKLGDGTEEISIKVRAAKKSHALYLTPAGQLTRHLVEIPAKLKVAVP